MRARVRDWIASNPNPTGRELAEAGYVVPHWPAPYGLNADAIEQLVIDDELNRAGIRRPPNQIGIGWAAPTILLAGTPEQHERYLAKIFSGEEFWCQLFSEPDAGSDLANLATRAVRDGDEYVINGAKIWSSGAHVSDMGILIARTDPDAPKHRGVTYFLIDMTQPGVDVRPLREMTGDAAFNEVFFDDARVHDSDRVGAEGDGWRIAMATLSFERDPDNVGLGDTAAFYQPDLSIPVGEHAVAEGAAADGFSITMAGRAEEVFAAAVSDDALSEPVRRDRRARVIADRSVMNWSSKRAAVAMTAGGPPGPEVAALKVGGAAIGRAMRDLGLEALGPRGTLWGNDATGDGLFHRWAMFTPAQSIAGGTDEVLRNSIGERVLGLPREPDEADRRSLPWNHLRRT